MSLITRTDPDGKEAMHAVMVTGKNADGTYTYYDPSTNETVLDYAGPLGFSFSIDRQAW